jgi:AbrB family looped-hinge helix DNA binding protein
MTKALARLTSKSQLVIPKPVRELLGVGPGDTLAFEYGPDGVRVEKAAAQDDPFATFHEWSGGADEEAYKDL